MLEFLKALVLVGKILFIESKSDFNFFPSAEPGEKKRHFL